MKFGTRTIWNGMMRVARIRANRIRLPRNSNTANAYAAIAQVTTWPNVASDAMTIEFWKKVPKVTPGRANHMVPWFSQWRPVGNENGAVANTSARVLSEVDSIHRNGMAIA